MLEKPKINELNKRIIIKKASIVKNSFGEPIYTYSNFLTVFSKVEQIQNQRYNEEKQKNAKMVNVVTLHFTIRYLQNITDEMFIYYRKVYYRISNINDLDNGFITILGLKLED